MQWVGCKLIKRLIVRGYQKHIMKKLSLILLSILLILVMISCSTGGQPGKITVAVGVVPEATFVAKVAGDIVDVVVLVPPGYSPANYQPSAKEMQALSEAEIYFTLHMPTEEANILPKVRDFNKNIQIINLREIVSNIYPLRMIDGHDHEEEEHEDEDEDELTIDPHLWLSPKRSIIMVQAIADALSDIDPDNSNVFQENAASYIKEIEALDSEIKIRIGELNNKSFMIYHGAYGYFAEDYSLEMISIEAAGKQATAAEIQEVIEHAVEEGIKVIFYQEEFDDNQAQTVAEEIGGKVIKVSPLSADYITSLRDFTIALGQQGD